MITFIIEYWWQIAVYLFGCVLAYGRMNCINQNYRGGWSKILLADRIDYVVSILFSWALFLSIKYPFREQIQGTKFFKWLPALLLCTLFAASCKNQPYKYQCLSTDGTSHGSYIQYPKGTRINWGSGDPAWMIDSCYQFVIKESALK